MQRVGSNLDRAYRPSVSAARSSSSTTQRPARSLYQIFGAHTSIDSFTTLSYSTYVTASTPGSGAAPTLQFDLYNGKGSYQGRLVFDRGLLGTVSDNAWQNWNVTTADAWCLSHPGLGNLFDQRVMLHPIASRGRSRSGWHLGRVCAVQGRRSGQADFQRQRPNDFALNSTTYNFDPAPGARTYDALSLIAAGLAGTAALRRRKKARAA